MSASLLVLCTTPRNVSAQATLQVEAGGDNLRAAFDKIRAEPGITEIVLADGLYEGSFRIYAPEGHKGDLPHLTVRAADDATPILRHALKITEAEAVDGAPGYYRIKRLPPSQPQMWERDMRVRYNTLATAGSVAAYAGSCFADRESGYLYFRTSDGQPPKAHDLWLALCARNSRALFIRRDNVAVDGLHFADYVADNGMAIQSEGDGVTIRNCRFDNCETAWGVAADTNDCLIENCVGVDVARGVYSHSNGIVIRGNRFTKTRDRFLYPLYPQNDSAYQVYHPGRGATIEGNFCKGYYQAIFLKAQAAPYIVRHNTVVDAVRGIGFSSGLKHDGVVDHNIIADAQAFLFIPSVQSGAALDHNLLWDAREIGELHNRMAMIRGSNAGKHDVFADPRFVDPANGDYRLLPDSPAVALADDKSRPAGAFGVAPPKAAKDAQPKLALAFASDTMPYGPFGDYTFDRDPWIGGGTTHVSDLTEQGAPQRLTGDSSITVHPRAFDATGDITKLRIAVDYGEPQVVDYTDKYTLTLPDAEGEHHLTFAVQNDRGTWSDNAEAVIRLDRTAPSPGLVHTRSNDHGLVVLFDTDEPCFAELRFGPSADELTSSRNTPPQVDRVWDSNDGGEWVKTWRVPRTQHALAVLAPDVAAGQIVHYQITLTDQAGLSRTTEVHQARVGGERKTFTLAPGAMSLQTAVDQALPGDRIVLMPGVYTDHIYIDRGGVEGAPLTIEAEEPRTVTFDGAKRVNALIHLESAAHVTIRGLRILYFKRAGIYAYRSPHLTVDQCSFYNGEGWTTGDHVFSFWSPRATITYNLAVGAEFGFYLLKSPHATVLHNTVSQTMYAAVSFVFSLDRSTLMYNSFAYAGNDIVHAELDPSEAINSFHSDYNNLGTNILGHNAALKSHNPQLYTVVKAESFAPPTYPRQFYTSSKAIVSIGTRYRTLKAWRDASGQDAHSIFADPEYIRPYPPVDSWDWRVSPNSPNLDVRNKNGYPIGAFESME